MKNETNWMDETMSTGRMLVAALVTMLMFVAIVFATSSAFAEDVNIISVVEYDVWDVEINGEELEEIQFEYDGQILAMYWDTIPEGPLWVKIWSNIEAVDAGEILPMRLQQPMLMQR